MNSLGDVLTSWRLEAGLTRREVRGLMGWRSTATLALHEAGQRGVRPDVLAAYARIYRRPEHDLEQALLLLARAGGGIGPCIPGQDEAPSAEAAAP